MPQAIEIRDGGTLDYDVSFFTKDEADALFERIRTQTPWKQEQSRFGPFPRLMLAGLHFERSLITGHCFAQLAGVA